MVIELCIKSPFNGIALDIGIHADKFTALRIKLHKNFILYSILVCGRLPKGYAFGRVLLHKTNKGLILLAYKYLFIWTDVGICLMLATDVGILHD